MEFAAISHERSHLREKIMTRNFQLLPKSSLKLQNLLESNPQLFREIKGKINGKNIFITSLLSVFIQAFIILLYFGQLPDIVRDRSQYSRYCTGLRGEYASSSLCIRDINGWAINWSLFWHDIFILFTIDSICILLTVGTFMIISDLVKEEKTGTLNFIRLSPQSASNILLGKIWGVPILVNFFIATIFPLHFISGLKANIPWYLILLFDLIVIASCAFYYSFSALFSLLKIEKAELKPWIATFILAFCLWITTLLFFDNHIDNLLVEWILIFNPITALTYVLDPLAIPSNLVDYMSVESLGQLLFYEQPLWSRATTGIGFILFNYCLWTYWLWQGATHIFHNPTSTIFSKKQSYWLTGWFVFIALGFTIQDIDRYSISDNFILLQFLLLIMFLGLVAALSPHRQTLYDWARYRHQMSKDGQSLTQELVFGEKSPSTVAIAINAGIATIIIAVGLLLFPFKEQVTNAIWGLVLTMGIILFYSTVAQWMLLIKSNRRVIWASITVSLLIIGPPIFFAIAELTPQQAPLVWLFSFIPTVAIAEASVSALVLGVLGQWLAITSVSFLMIKKLRKAGRSETKKLFGEMKA